MAAALIPFAAAGCSLRLSGRELAMGYSAERNGMERRVVPGLDLRIGGPWPGFDAGLSDTTVAGESSGKVSDTGPGRYPRYTPPLGWAWRRGGEIRHAGWFYRDTLSPTGAVQFIGEAKVGFSTVWHPAATSLDLGIRRQTAVIAHRDASGIFQIDFSSRRPLDGGIRTEQTTKETP